MNASVAALTAERFGHWRPAAPVRRTATAILVAIAAFFANSPVLRAAEAAPASEPRVFTHPGEARAGSLLLKHGNERFTDAPRVGTDIDLTVSGPTIRARVTQVFHNPTNDWVEAVYVYPLPEGGAVDTLKMVVGDRIVIGEIKERQQARAQYEAAKQAGQKAALTEQERPNIFTNSVANIGPGETVLVQLEYQEPVRQSGDIFSLRVPLVIGPRYNPAPIVQNVDLPADGSGWTQAQDKANDPVPDRNRISPPVLNPATVPPTNPVSISVRLQAGFPLGEVTSPHHTMLTETPSDDVRVLKLAEGPVPADRDFELNWKPAAAKAPSVGLFRERVGDADYLLAFVTPPAVEPTEKPAPREVVFVIDNSGSMGGTSMVQAKASLIYALSRLKPADRFNVIRFDDTMDVMFPVTVPASAENVGQAKAFVGALQARGGTEMVPPMKAALADRRDAEPNYVRQVVFLTDGAIGNEQQLFDTITSMRGRSRVFMVGIGSAPNTYLMTRASELGRGTFTHIGSTEQVDERMRSLFDKLENPVVTGLTAKFSAAQADITPSNLPDIYRGEPLVLAGKLDKLEGDIEIKGQIGDRPWTITLPVARAAEGRGLSKLWARRKIADAEVARTLRQMPGNEADQKILALALEHQLVTRLTSLLAVDKTPSRPEGEKLKLAELPLNLPAGWEFDKVFGERPALKNPSERRADAAEIDATARRLADASAPAKPSPNAQVNAQVAMAAMPPNGMQLPKTATDAEIRMVSGLALLVLSLLLLVFGRRRFAAA